MPQRYPTLDHVIPLDSCRPSSFVVHQGNLPLVVEMTTVHLCRGSFLSNYPLFPVIVMIIQSLVCSRWKTFIPFSFPSKVSEVFNQLVVTVNMSTVCFLPFSLFGSVLQQFLIVLFLPHMSILFFIPESCVPFLN